MSPTRATRKLEAIQAALGVSPDAAMVSLVESGKLRDALIAWTELDSALSQAIDNADTFDRRRTLYGVAKSLQHLKRFVVETGTRNRAKQDLASPTAP